MATSRKDNIVEVSESTRLRYFKNLAAQIHQLRLAMERSDNETVREICHRVRGSAGLFGLKDLGEACRDVEVACLEKNAEAIVAGFQVIEVMAGRHLSPCNEQERVLGADPAEAS